MSFPAPLNPLDMELLHSLALHQKLETENDYKTILRLYLAYEKLGQIVQCVGLQRYNVVYNYRDDTMLVLHRFLNELHLVHSG